MRKKVVMEFCNGERVETTSAIMAVATMEEFFKSLPATEEEKKRYAAEFDAAAAKANEIGSDVIVYDPFVRIHIEVEED